MGAVFALVHFYWAGAGTAGADTPAARVYIAFIALRLPQRSSDRGGNPEAGPPAGEGALVDATATSWWISRRPSERCRRTDGRRGCAKRRWPPAPPNPTKRLRNTRPMPPSRSRPPKRQRRASRRTSPASPTAPCARRPPAPRRRAGRRHRPLAAAAAPLGLVAGGAVAFAIRRRRRAAQQARDADVQVRRERQATQAVVTTCAYILAAVDAA